MTMMHVDVRDIREGRNRYWHQSAWRGASACEQWATSTHNNPTGVGHLGVWELDVHGYSNYMGQTWTRKR